MSWQHVRAVLIGAAEAAAGSALPLVLTQSWAATVATFVVFFVVAALGNLFHLQLTPQQQQQFIAALTPALAQLGPALVALVEHLRQPASSPVLLPSPAQTNQGVPTSPPQLTILPHPADPQGQS